VRARRGAGAGGVPIKGRGPVTVGERAREGRFGRLSKLWRARGVARRARAALLSRCGTATAGPVPPVMMGEGEGRGLSLVLSRWRGGGEGGGGGRLQRAEPLPLLSKLGALGVLRRSQDSDAEFDLIV
jgi:hypothetical protein